LWRGASGAPLRYFAGWFPRDIAIVSIVLTRQIEQPLDCTSPMTLSRSYRTRFFMRVALAQAVALFGFTFGGGLAYALDQNWSIGAEYRYTRYQAENFALGPVAAFCANVGAVAPLIACTNVPATGHVGLRTSELLLKANYRFSGP
jgi:hypothetical protein